ncbi:EamA family transporter [Bacillus gobiensis]|uniref:EamA family transporter n=1 Tax=Bacillus gobiensis TaxID=1441095 RepID=UPI003D1FA141
MTGELLIIVSALSWACANVFSKVKFSGDEIMNMTAWQLLIGAIILFVISIMTENVSQTEWTLPAVLSLRIARLHS